jgi:hypothetical protein
MSFLSPHSIGSSNQSICHLIQLVSLQLDSAEPASSFYHQSYAQAASHQCCQSVPVPHIEGNNKPGALLQEPGPLVLKTGKYATAVGSYATA